MEALTWVSNIQRKVQKTFESFKNVIESQNLNIVSKAPLCGKLREKELDLRRLNEDEKKGKKKTLIFKFEVDKGKNIKEDEDFEEDE